MARVLVDVPLAHLDRPFDYLVPGHDGRRRPSPGARVKVRFAGQDVDGFVVARAATQRPRAAGWRRCAGWSAPSRCCRPRSPRSARAVAARYAGTRSDVLRLAVPPRHATTEKRAVAAGARAGALDLGRAARRLGGPRARRARSCATWPTGGVAAGGVVGAPGTDWPHAGRPRRRGDRRRGPGRAGCVPDRRDVARVDAALTAVLGADQHVVLTADAGPGAALPRFLAVSRGAAPGRGRHPRGGLRAGARPRPGGDLGRRRRPARRAAGAVPPHPRGAAAARRAARARPPCVGGFARTVEAEYLLRTGWARELAAARGAASGPRLTVARHRRDRPRARARPARRAAPGCPREAHQRDPGRRSSTGRCWCRRRARATPPSLACERCRDAGPLPRLLRPAARCPRPTAPPTCRWCGTEQPAWACAECGHRGLRAPVLGDAPHRRGARPRVPGRPGAHLERRPGARRRSADRPAIVVATPGAEPVADGGYAAVVLLDTWLMLARDRPARRRRRRCGAGPTPSALVRRRRPGRRRRRPRPPRAAGAGALGPGRLRRARDRASGRRRTCRRRPGWRR